MRVAFTTLTLLLTFSELSHANICGTDYQNFNPTTNGLDFVTVQSSETLRPCFLNFGLFFNYAANTLTYTRSSGTALSGTKANDRTLGADLNMGFGITDRWDFGFSIPYVVSQETKDNVNVSFFNQTGITEFKINTKYRFTGDDSGGTAIVLSMNNNLIKNNPFAGDGAGPTLNFELVADTTVDKWAFGANVGYRKRQPGSQIPNVPFVPMKDQWIYSVASSFNFESIDSKLIGEIVGARPANSVDQDTDRNLNSMEWLLGLKHDLSRSMAIHIGGGTQLFDSLGSPDWRVYTGLNWAIGPVCNNNPTVEQISNPEEPKAVAKPALYRLSTEVLFAFDSDQIRQEDAGSLNAFMEKVKAMGFHRMLVIGHTDSIGAADYNLRLSERRALAVKRHLSEKFGFDAKTIESYGKGASEPIADNRNYQGRQKNRRVEFHIWK